MNVVVDDHCLCERRSQPTVIITCLIKDMVKKKVEEK